MKGHNMSIYCMMACNDCCYEYHFKDTEEHHPISNEKEFLEFLEIHKNHNLQYYTDDIYSEKFDEYRLWQKRDEK